MQEFLVGLVRTTGWTGYSRSRINFKAHPKGLGPLIDKLAQGADNRMELVLQYYVLYELNEPRSSKRIRREAQWLEKEEGKVLTLERLGRLETHWLAQDRANLAATGSQ